MFTLETTQTFPLEVWEDGTIRVKGTRLLIDMIVNAHNRGECPEEIFESFPSTEYTVADIYSVIAYYLSHKSKIDKYLTKREKEAEKIWKKIESDPKHQARTKELREKLLTRWENRK
ncbi:MAG: DUF433 domain-containing protein [Acidobacteriota bacterium]|jgi:uncharacterized protein (DUF433 family)|nr:DUF433 domain-containing protein [Acidobacteriota bacterium]